MNRAQRRKAVKSQSRRQPTQREMQLARRQAEKMYAWRYCEDHWWRMTTGHGFRGLVPANKQDEAHNLALFLPLRWQAISITYLQDPWGKKYRAFGIVRTHQALKGAHTGICPVLDAALNEAEESVNSKHIYARGMVFSPLSKAHDSLLPILRLKMKELRLNEQDLQDLQEMEDEWKQQGSEANAYFVVPEEDIHMRIAALL